MNVAQWTLHPITEREIAQQQRRAQVARRLNCSLACVFGIGLPLSCFGALGSGNTGLLTLALLALVGLGIETWRRDARDTGTKLAHQRAMREAYVGIDGWLAEIVVMQGFAITGRDRGALWFEDGKLLFVGERTSFGLVSTQAGRELQESRWPISDLVPKFAIDLRIMTAGGDAKLGIEHLSINDPEHGHESTKRFRQAYKKWASQKCVGDGQFPPLEVGPDVPTARELFRMAFVNTTLWTVAAALATLILLSISLWIAPVIVVFAGAVSALRSDLWVPALRWRAWRDRKRLDKTPRWRLPLG